MKKYGFKNSLALYFFLPFFFTFPAVASETSSPLSLDIYISDTFPLKDLNGDLTEFGVQFETLQDSLSQNNIAFNIHPLPWARAFRNAQNNQNSIIFGLNRNKTREDNFHWLKAIFEEDGVTINLYGRNDEELKNLSKINILEKKYTVICKNETVQCFAARNFGFSRDQIIIVPKRAELTYLEQFILDKRVDLLIGTQSAVQKNLLSLNENKDALIPIFEIIKLKPYIGASRNVNPNVLLKLSQIFKGK